MKFLFASDSFKGTLSSRRTAELLTQAAEEIFPGCECAGLEVADGGEGTTEAVLSAVDGRRIPVSVKGPLWEQREAFYGALDENRAVMEMAEASGLPLVPKELRDPRNTTTFGTGEMIRDAIDRGFRDISIAIGGSATNDGGIGCMRALGVRFLDESGQELRGCGADLIKIRTIDCSGLDTRIKERKVRFTVMCDVKNPLCGADGAAYTFGKQKGGTPEMLDELEAGMQNYRDLLLQEFGVNMDEVPGAGAAGGLGAALTAFLNAELKSGIETVLDLIGFEEKLQGVSLVVTGEGRADWQSVFGKVMQGVGSRCQRMGVPAVAIVGSMGTGAEQIFDHGIESIMTTVNGIMPLEEAMERAEELYLGAARRMFRMLRAARGL
ncbi:glycerate kinase [Lachnoclostridium sp. An131]|uniref:glycerate kinase family protein n=1 Tax=Lachnoclostridium sp. An131 TaxID=1965555 RepID=UPI000B3962B8|nr:glycerate kinase [Lachnoclostridium sp. An131]OUQ26564.1 glycerate kinase [Lachnoclostridium sp. An131]